MAVHEQKVPAEGHAVERRLTQPAVEVVTNIAGALACSCWCRFGSGSAVRDYGRVVRIGWRGCHAFTTDTDAPYARQRKPEPSRAAPKHQILKSQVTVSANSIRACMDVRCFRDTHSASVLLSECSS